MSGTAPVNLHASAIRLGTLGILIRGASGSGKSALALCALRRAEALGLHGVLVADDQVFLEAGPDGLDAVAPEATAGLIEVRGVGILRERFVARAAMGLVVDLLEPAAIERLPDAPTASVGGIFIPRIALPAREAGFGADVLATLARGGRRDNTPVDLNQF